MTLEEVHAALKERSKAWPQAIVALVNLGTGPFLYLSVPWPESEGEDDRMCLGVLFKNGQLVAAVDGEFSGTPIADEVVLTSLADLEPLFGVLPKPVPASP